MNAKQQQSNHFFRVKINGTLTCLSPLHIGAGLEIPLIKRDDGISREPVNKESSANNPPSAGKEPDYLPVPSDNNERPVIPAASLRGSLLSGRDQQGDDVISWLFGFANKNKSQAGKLRIYDATLKQEACPAGDLSWHNTRKTILHQGISIDAITGTTKNHHLFSHELVPTGSIFDVEILLQEVSLDQIATTIGLLKLWDGESNSALGTGRSKGWGKVKWSLDGLSHLQDENILQWLQAPEKPLQGFYTPWQIERIQNLDLSDAERIFLKDGDKILELKPTAIATNLATQSINIWIKPEGPLLINQPSLCEEKVGEKNDAPNLNYRRRHDDHALIPGSTLRGLVSARASRILASIAHLHYEASPNHAKEIAAELVPLLFGSTDQRSPLWFDDAVSDKKMEAFSIELKPKEEGGEQEFTSHRQFFNAIDRFTGGVAEGALYQVEAALCSRLQVTCRLEVNRQPEGDWWKGLLLFVLRDALEGDLAIGWGKAKGYGKFSAGVLLDDQDCTHLAGVLDNIKGNGDDPQQWVSELHEKIKTLANVKREVTP